jgi:signal transduction histidine kinase
MMQRKKKTQKISDDGIEALRGTHMASLDTLDFSTEKLRLEETQRAVLNILEDFNIEKNHLERTQRATFNILEDFSTEKLRLEETQRAVLNILEDFNPEKLRLEDTQRALLNILDDLNQSNEELQKAHDVLEIRVAERTAELQRSNAQLRAEMEERKKAEEALRRRTNELARSNAELEQFAYIASHDLQEPLRMVSSYVQLLAKRYRGKLDQDADDFIGYASDGASRMQKLINDLLAYSRVGTRGKSFEEVSLEAALTQALENLQLAIKEKNAIVTHDPLPVAYGDGGQLTQVFQNLIDNAIKFRSEEPPRVHVSARLEGGECVCSVQDNGIGIAPEYLNRLFLLFQRLHTRKEYPGTGIGLAICKRIVERHGGKIWVESKPGEGSTFYFRIPTTQRSHYDG